MQHITHTHDLAPQTCMDININAAHQNKCSTSCRSRPTNGCIGTKNSVLKPRTAHELALKLSVHKLSYIWVVYCANDLAPQTGVSKHHLATSHCALSLQRAGACAHRHAYSWRINSRGRARGFLCVRVCWCVKE